MELDATTLARDPEEATAMDADGPAVADVEPEADPEPEAEAEPEPEPEPVVEPVPLTDLSDAKPETVQTPVEAEPSSSKVVSEPPPVGNQSPSPLKSEARSGKKRAHPDD